MAVFPLGLPGLTGSLLEGLAAETHLPGTLHGLDVGGGLILAIGTLGPCKPFVSLLQPPEDVCVRSDGPALWVRARLDSLIPQLQR